jgi:hypothetical protein
MTRKEMKIMKYVKSLVLLATLSALPKIATADVTLVFDSGWIAGGEGLNINTDTMSGQLTGVVFDLEFDRTDWTNAGDGLLCVSMNNPPVHEFGGYDLSCDGVGIGDFPSSWDNKATGHFTHSVSFSPITLVNADLLWTNGWSSSPVARWHGTVVLVGVEYDNNDPYGACCYLKNCEYWVCEEMYRSECSTLFDGTHWANKTCDDIDCPNFSGFELGACCVEDAAGGMICYFVKDTDCESYGGVWHPGIPCDCEPCTPLSNDCIVTPSTNCVGRPQYPHPDYLAFGNGHIAIETASTSILGGSTVMLFDLSGTLPVDTAFPLLRYSHPSWEHPNSDPAPDMGSIFGLAVDEAGNIYVSSTKTWWQDIAGTYGWGAVYKIDTNTALPELFASIPMPNNESSLGTITYDCDHSQFFVSSFEDGIIYRLDMSGNILDTYDHGTPYAGAPGPAAFGDRPWAVEVHGNRLYYSLWNENEGDVSTTMDNEIWSVSLDGAGTPIGGTSQLEITSSPYNNLGDWSSPVSDIDFSPTGTMFVSERTQHATQVSAHRSAVREYECTSTGWVLATNQYFVGISNGKNATGGVDATSHGIWASGDALHFATGDFIYGFQGLPLSGGNTTTSVLVDYQDNTTGSDKTMLGDIVVTDEDGGSGETGVCCYQDNCASYCDMRTEDDCLAFFGSTYFPNTTCATVNCPPPPEFYGACCYQIDNVAQCFETDAIGCENVLGLWYPGLPCECIPCDQPKPRGACCYFDTTSGLMICAEMFQYDCDKKPESSYAGDYTVCDDEYCCKPIGACCVNGQCLLVTQNQCEIGGGSYLGDGAVCDNVQCDYCPADLNNDDVVNVADILLLIGAWGISP